jgi:hypothetical protein
MNKPEHFELRNGYAYYRPVGEMPLAEAIELVRLALVYCTEQGLPCLLVNCTALTGLGEPSMADRFFMATKWASVAANKVTVAMVLTPALMHPQKFGVMVARNRGVKGDAFLSEAEAEAWLLASRVAETAG